MKKIIKFINTNILLSVLLIIPIFCIIKFTEISLISVTPNFLEKIFLKPKINSSEYELFRILENLSLAYISSLIFYIIIDYVPKEKMTNKSYEIIKTDLINLYLYMSEIIVSLKTALNVTKDINNIALDDVQKLDNFEIKNEPVYYKTYSIIDEIKSTDMTMEYFNYYSDIPKYGGLVKKTINKIKNMPCTAYADFEILEIISSIESSHFLYQIENIKNELIIIEDIPITRKNFGMDFYDFVQSYLKLDKYKFKKHSYYKEPMTEDEKKQYIKDKAKILKEISLIHKINYISKSMYNGKRI